MIYIYIYVYIIELYIYICNVDRGNMEHVGM